MAGGIVAEVAALATDIGKRSSGSGSRSDHKPNSSSSPGFKGDKSVEPRKISGTRCSFNVKGDGSMIEVQGGTINNDYFSGSVNFTKGDGSMTEVQGGTINNDYFSGSVKATKAGAFQDHHPLDECSGTDKSFNVEAGGKIIVAVGGSICSSAFSGNSIPREFSPQDLANLQPVVPPSRHSTN